MGESEIAKEGGGKIGRRPTISVPPRAPFESLFAGGTMPGYSPGPMTLLANIFSPDSGSCSFSQLLAGAIVSPLAKPEIPAAADFGDYKDSEKGPAYKQNKPVDLVVTQAQSPMFSFPPGLSPTGFLNSPGFLSPLQSPFGMSHQQALAHVTAQAALSQYVQNQADFQRESSELSQYVSGEAMQQQQVHTLHMDPQHTLKVEVEPSTVAQPQSEHKPGSSGFDKPGSDGYNWRKYGQKIVKAKEYPRSYYKCTYACCPVKKKVEHGNDGQVTEITYKGQHNHEKPSPNPRTKDNSGSDRTSRVKPESKVSNEATLHFKNTEGASTQVSYGQLLMPAGKDEMEDSATVINDNHEDEPNAKRRNTEVVVAQAPAPTHQTITEPKIVVQTRSEVDLLDDGFKWRKYGQKVVKGSVHPRSYYRCTFGGCNVRKHVERASLDPKSVITTYEGKHNHEIPSGRNSGQSKPQSVLARKPPPSVYKEVDFENKDQVAVLTRI